MKGVLQLTASCVTKNGWHDFITFHNRPCKNDNGLPSGLGSFANVPGKLRKKCLKTNY